MILLRRISFAICLIIFSVASVASAADPAPSAPPVPQPQAAGDRSLKEYLYGSTELGNVEFGWEADLYYSNISLNIPLTGTPIPKVEDADELEIYTRLLANSLLPRYLLIEAAVMPMPLAGVAVNEYANHFYNSANVGKKQNVISWITAGFEEPWAATVFLGDMINFHKPGESKLSSNKGYMGYMFSYSNQHIKNNRLIRDNSLEAEWKLKGEKNYKDDKLSWSFRFGAKIHDNPNIANTFYVGLRRSNLDFRVTPFDFIKNSTIDFRWDISLKTGAMVRQEYIIGKRFPIKSWGVAFKLDAGVIWEDPSRYSGPLKDPDFPNFSIVLRPNIIF